MDIGRPEFEIEVSPQEEPVPKREEVETPAPQPAETPEHVTV